MPVDSWLPVGYELPDGRHVRRRLHHGRDWEIFETSGGARTLVATAALAERWLARLLPESVLKPFSFGEHNLASLAGGREHTLQPVSVAGDVPSKAEAMAFAVALRESRSLEPQAPLHDAIYVEKYTRLLPTYGLTSIVADEVVLGYWLTGGVSVPASSFRRLNQLTGWPSAQDLREVVEAAGFHVSVIVPGQDRRPPGVDSRAHAATQTQPSASQEDEPTTRPRHEEAAFVLPGRPDLEVFFNEHVIDILRNRDRYMAIGIGFPSPIVLHGPPGTGKTFAVERLVEFLGWPSYEIDASSVASPYIHETSRKVGAVFDAAIENAPSVLIIDEMDAFLADREGGAGQHRVEEVAEFLRRIPKARDKDVLVVGMTNRIDLIDRAILRRGRFDHVLEVGFSTEDEVSELLERLLATVPTSGDIPVRGLARKLSGRPLSDVAFVVREGARLAVRAGEDALDEACLVEALAKTPSLEDPGSQARVGFV